MKKKVYSNPLLMDSDYNEKSKVLSKLKYLAQNIDEEGIDIENTKGLDQIEKKENG